MAEEIKQAGALTDEENRRLFGWGENIFGVAALNLIWRPKDVHFLMYSEGQPVSHVGVLRHVVSVDGEPVTVGGLGGVVTVPTARKKGFARQLMRHATNFLGHEWGVDAGLLFCLPELAAYYGALGWQEVKSPVLIEQPRGKIVSPLCVMVLPVRKEGWSFESTELRSLPW
jgi:GNAT superfamily N-acetyltransferase